MIAHERVKPLLCIIIKMEKYKAKKIEGETKQVHRLVWENYWGCKLKAEEVIHHKDGNKSNNAIGNLRKFETKSEHTKFHMDNGDLHKIKTENKKQIINERVECSRCGESKKINEFETRKSAHLGILGVCKECRNAPRRQQR